MTRRFHGTTEDEPVAGLASHDHWLTGLAASTTEDPFTLFTECQAPAPLSLNGGLFVGCSLEKDHDGDHEVKVSWPR